MGEKGRVFVSGFWPKNRSKSIDLNCVLFFEKNRNKRGNNSYQRVKEIKIVKVREREIVYIHSGASSLVFFVVRNQLHAMLLLFHYLSTFFSTIHFDFIIYHFLREFISLLSLSFILFYFAKIFPTHTMNSHITVLYD